MMAHSLEEIAEMVQRTRFHRKLIGGVDEEDAWRVMQRLAEEYTARIEADRKTMLRTMREDRRRIAELEALLAAQEDGQTVRYTALPEREGKADGI